MIDFSKKKPYYEQLKEILVTKIERGEWSSGAKIPSENYLTKHYSVSRATVRQAITELVNTGYLYRRQGIGTFVLDEKIGGKLLQLRYPEKFGDKHILLGVKKISASSLIAEKLSIEKFCSVYETVRLRLFNSEPVAVEVTYLECEKFPDLEQHLSQGLLYDLLKEKYGVTISTYESTVEPVIMKDAHKDHLNVSGDYLPGLLITKIVRDSEGNSLVMTQSTFRGDRCKLIFDYKD